MATASSLVCEDQFDCSICADLFTNPVSLPCGHNFCNACIQRYWKDKKQCLCPLCKQEFSKSLKLCVNTLFRDIVDKYKEDQVCRDSEMPISAEDVLCDCCLHSRNRAAKTCLVCLTSYCETHLEPHLKVATLKTHKLTDPVPKLEEKTCTKHNRILEGHNSQKPVCELCSYETQNQYNQMSNETKSKSETQPKDLHDKVTNSKIKKTRKMNTDETGGLQNVQIWVNDTFYTFSSLPPHRGFSSGRIFYEVPITSGCGWELGVVSDRMQRKGVFSVNTDGRWIVRLDTLVNCKKGCPCFDMIIPDRVLLCVDYEKGFMYICHPLNGIIVFTMHNCRFRGRLFLFTNSYTKQHMINNIQNFSSTKWIKNVVLCLVFLLTLYISLSQPAVWGPFGVHENFAGGTRNKFSKRNM